MNDAADHRLTVDVSEAKASLVMWLGSIVAASSAIVIAALLFAIHRAAG